MALLPSRSALNICPISKRVFSSSGSSVMLVPHDVAIVVAPPVAIACGKIISGRCRIARYPFVAPDAAGVGRYYRDPGYRGFRFGYWRRLKRKRAAEGDVCQAREEQ